MGRDDGGLLVGLTVDQALAQAHQIAHHVGSVGLRGEPDLVLVLVHELEVSLSVAAAGHDLDFTQTALRVYMACMLLFGIQMACQMTFTSLGKAKASILVAVTRKFNLLIPLIYLLPAILPLDKTLAVYMAEPEADLIAVTFTAVFFTFQFKKVLKEIA